MNLRQLTIFKTVCEELSFTKAAEKLYMTQPAVSHVILDLEKEIGFVLFERIARKIYISESGKIVYEKAIQLLEMYRDLTENFSEIEASAPLRVGSSITIANFWLPRIIKKMQDQQEKIKCKIEIDSAAHIEQKLLSHDLDIALIEGIIQNEKLIKIPFSSYKMCVICSPQCKYASDKVITKRKMLEEPLLLREKGSAIRDALDSAFLLENLLIQPAWTSVNSQALIQAVKENLGLSVLPQIIVQKEIEAGELIPLEIEGISLQNKNYVVYHQDKFYSKAMKYFTDAVRINFE